MLDGRPVWVTIPTIGKSKYLVPLINRLQQDTGVDQIILTVNLEEYVEPIRECFRFCSPNIEIVQSWPMGKSLYHGWNISIDMARSQNAWLAVLNDDIQLQEDFAISSVVKSLYENPNYAILGLNWQDNHTNIQSPVRQVHGTYRHSGVGGFAWVCDPHKIDFVPNDIVHWGGDDFIFFRAEDRGYKVGIATNFHVQHPEPETTSSTQSWTFEARIKDREVFNKYYPGRGW